MTQDKDEDLLLIPKEIGDNLDLEVEASYPCSDGSSTKTISVDRLLKAQLAKARPIIEKQERKTIYQGLIWIMRNAPDLKSLEREMSYAIEALKGG